jgi:hypothetical protein
VAIVGLTVDGKKIVQAVVTGPSSYATGGFTVTMGELSKIHAASVSVRSNLKADNYVHAVDYAVSDNTITFKVYRIDVTAGAPSAWSEVPAGTDLSDLTLEVVAIGV